MVKLQGEITHHKQHLLWGFRNATTCVKYPQHMKKEIQTSINKKKELKY